MTGAGRKLIEIRVTPGQLEKVTRIERRAGWLPRSTVTLLRANGEYLIPQDQQRERVVRSCASEGEGVVFVAEGGLVLEGRRLGPHRVTRTFLPPDRP